MNAGMLAYAVNMAFEVYIFILFARVLCSWIRINPYGKIFQFIFSLTEPLLAPIRKIMPRTGMVDFSPMILMIVLIILQRVILTLIYAAF